MKEKISREKFFVNHKEPQYSESEILRLQLKYGISEDDLKNLKFNIIIEHNCD